METYTADTSDHLVWLARDDQRYQTCVPSSSLHYSGLDTSLCGFGVFEFTTIILGQESKYENNSSKFSVGLGVIIWSFISFYIMTKQAALSDSTEQALVEIETRCLQ